jgi:hypothetical protein
MTNQNAYSLTTGMKTKTLTIASIVRAKEVNDAKLIATSPGCSRMGARQAVPDDRERRRRPPEQNNTQCWMPA